MPIEGIFADGREIKSVSKRSADLLTISLPPPLLLLFHFALLCAGVIKFSTPLSGIAVWISGEIKRFARLCTFAARRGAARHGDAAADRRDAASRSRALQIVTTIPIQTPPTKASRVEGEKRRGRGRAGEHFGIPSVSPKNTFSHSSERASPPPRSRRFFYRLSSLLLPLNPSRFQVL